MSNYKNFTFHCNSSGTLCQCLHYNSASGNLIFDLKSCLLLSSCSCSHCHRIVFSVNLWCDPHEKHFWGHCRVLKLRAMTPQSPVRQLCSAFFQVFSLLLLMLARAPWGQGSGWFHPNSVCWMNKTPPFSFLDINILVLKAFCMTFPGLGRLGQSINVLTV